MYQPHEWACFPVSESSLVKENCSIRFDAEQDGNDSSVAHAFKFQMEALLQFGSPAGPIDLDEQQAQQSTGQKILSAEGAISIV